MAQVDLDEHRNRHQPLSALDADGADGAGDDRRAACEREGRLADVDGAPVERPPLRSVSRRAERAGGSPMSEAASTRCLYLDLDGTLLGRGASLLHDGEGDGHDRRACARCRRACAPASRSC